MSLEERVDVLDDRMLRLELSVASLVAKLELAAAHLVKPKGGLNYLMPKSGNVCGPGNVTVFIPSLEDEE